MEAWVGLVGMAIVALATIIATQLQARHEAKERQRDREERQKDRDEQYRWMLYPKRLEVHQQAFALLRQLNTSVPDSIKDMKEAKTATIDETKCKVDEWWASNRFYLDEESQEMILTAISSAECLVIDYAVADDCRQEWDDHQLGLWREDRDQFRICIRATMKALEKGIEMKHIEKPQREQQQNP